MPWRRCCAVLVAALLLGGPAGAQEFLPAGTVFQPPDATQLDFAGDLPEERQSVEKDTRIVAVIFSVAQMDTVKQAFPDVASLDFLDIGGRPMIEHVIRGLKTSRYVDRIIVVSDPQSEALLPFEEDPMLTFLADKGDAAENVKHGIHEIARGDLVLLVPSDLVLLSGANIDPLIDHARQYPDIDVFFPLLQRERCEGTLAAHQRFIRFREGYFTGAHVEIVRPALFVDNPEDVAQERGTMYEVYNLRRNALGVVRFLGLRLVWKFIVNDLSPSDVATRIYLKYHVRAQAFVTTDSELASDLDDPAHLEAITAALRTSAAPAPVAAAGVDS